MLHAIRWGALLTWIAALAAVSRWTPRPERLVASHVRVEDRPRREAPDFPTPRKVEGPSPGQLRSLSESARAVGPAMMYVGHPKGDSGSAFVISRRHRLLATNAHVAQIMEEAGGLMALENGTFVAHDVEKVYYHPDYAVCIFSGVGIFAEGQWAEYSRGPLPDLAVLRLTPSGPELKAECALAREFAPVGTAPVALGHLGFSDPYPAPGLPMEAAFSAGTVGLTTAFAPAGVHSPRWRLIDYNARSRSGDSGGPIFDESGRVVAIHAYSRRCLDQAEVPCIETAVGIDVAALWELLDHHGLAGLLEP